MQMIRSEPDVSALGEAGLRGRLVPAMREKIRVCFGSHLHYYQANGKVSQNMRVKRRKTRCFEGAPSYSVVQRQLKIACTKQCSNIIQKQRRDVTCAR